MSVAFIEPDQLNKIRLVPSLEPFRAILKQLATANHREDSPLVANVRTTIRLLRLGDVVLPVTINEKDFDNAWVCSPFNSTITYPLDEIRHVKSKPIQMAIKGLVYSIAPLLKLADINQVVCVNNWLLSTNLYPAELESQSAAGFDVGAITDFLVQQYPAHAILFRSLNQVTNASQIVAFRKRRYLLAASRQVYFYDGVKQEFLNHQNTQRDLKLLQDCKFQKLQHDDFDQTHDSRIKELYDLLYLEKYSQHNPQFTEQLIRFWRQSGTMRLFGLLSDGNLFAVVGTFAMGNLITAPLVGYDTGQPQSKGLYRLLMAYIFQSVMDDGQLLNLSAGAASFKRLRGGEPALEYSAVYCRHLPVRQRAVWKTLAVLLEHVGGNILRRYQL